jgi:hypothetical protein
MSGAGAQNCQEKTALSIKKSGFKILRYNLILQCTGGVSPLRLASNAAA